MGSVMNCSSVMILMSTTSPTGRTTYGKYGIQRPRNEQIGLSDVKKVISIVSNTSAVFSAMRFYTSSAFNVRNNVKIMEMGQLKIWPTDLTQALLEREKTGWRAGSVRLLGEEKCKNNVVSLFMILRS